MGMRASERGETAATVWVKVFGSSGFWTGWNRVCGGQKEGNPLLISGAIISLIDLRLGHQYTYTFLTTTLPCSLRRRSRQAKLSPTYCETRAKASPAHTPRTLCYQ